MLILLPLLVFALIMLLCLHSDYEFREAFVAAAVVWGVVVAGSTEVLSAVDGLTRTGIALAWLAAGALAFLYLRRASRSFAPEWRSALGEKWAGRPRTCPAGASGIVAGCVIIAAGVGLIALVSPPNTPDAMLYHMPRAVYWLQHQNVSLYPTIYPPQVFMPPWSEYALTHLFALAEGDRFVNLVQWFSLVGCGLGVSLVARSLGAGPSGKVFAAAAAMTVPQGIMQASGAKND